MAFRISSTFTEALGKLSGDEQRQVKVTVYDLLVDPSAPGLKFHRLEHAKDRGFWSARVNDGLRIIVHRRGDSMLLCYVGHHDRAYPWAERRKLEEHPETGAVTIIEVREKIREVEVPVYVNKVYERGGLFDNVTDEVLQSVGVPLYRIPEVRKVTEDSLCDLTLPSKVLEALVDMVTGKVSSQGALVKPLDFYLSTLQTSVKGGGSRRTAEQCLQRVATMLSPGTSAQDFKWESLTVDQMQYLLKELPKSYSKTTSNATLGYARRVFQAAFVLGYVDTATYVEVTQVRYTTKEVRHDRDDAALVEDFSSLNVSGIARAGNLAIRTIRCLRKRSLAQFTTSELYYYMRGRVTDTRHMKEILEELTRCHLVRRVPRTPGTRGRPMQRWEANPGLFLADSDVGAKIEQYILAYGKLSDTVRVQPSRVRTKKYPQPAYKRTVKPKMPDVPPLRVVL